MIKFKSLSSRLILYSFLFTGLLTIGMWALLYAGLKRELEVQDEGMLRDKIQTIASLLPPTGANRSLLTRRIEKEWYERNYEHVYVRVLSSDGEIITETPNLTKEHPEILGLLKKRAKNGTQGKLERLETESGGVYQVTSVEMRPSDNSKYIVEVALERTGEQNLLLFFRGLLPMIILIAAGASLWTARVIMRVALQPIRSFSEHAKQINSDSLSDRIAVADLPTEFHELASTLNSMLDRLRDSFDRLTQFSEDMAHELRTPVNNLLGSMTVAMARERTADGYSAVIESGIEECERLRRIIESLLFIARSASPIQAIQKQTLDLTNELQEIVGFYEASAEEAGIDMRLQASSGVHLKADRTLLQRCVGNLISNSIRHSAKGSNISLKVLPEPEFVRIEVTDQGCGIPKTALKQIGDRFFRVDSSRSKVHGGTGLGLSIVKSIMTIHGGTMTVQSQMGSGTTVALMFPN